MNERSTPPQVFAAPLRLTDVWRARSGASDRLYHGDNLAVLAALLPGYAGKVSLIYLDPPFLARQIFHRQVDLPGRRIKAEAYSDVWSGGLSEYLRALQERLVLVRELLCAEGSLFVHVNWRVAPYVQILLDEVFGAGERDGPGRPGFRNEIVWGFGGGGNARNAYRRKHDNLFWYTKSRKWCFRPQYRPYTTGTRQRGLTAVKGPAYELREEGASLETWWTDPGVQKILSPTALENLKYPTQKPESLLERIIEGHSEPGHLVADFYCGSGTTPAVAARLGRRWLAGDSSPLAVAVTWQRLVGVHHALSKETPTTPAVALYRQVGFGEADPTAFGSAAYLSGESCTSVTLRGYRTDECPGAVLDAVDYWAVDFRVGERRLPPQPGTTLAETARPQPSLRFKPTATDPIGADWSSDIRDATFQHDLFACRYGARKRELPLALAANVGIAHPPRVKVFDCFGREAIVEAVPEPS